MKLFISKGYHLGALAVPAKLVYTLFLLFILLGLWSSALMYGERIGAQNTSDPGQISVQERYVNRPAKVVSGGPALDLGDEPAEPAPKPQAAAAEDLKRPWILDVFHQHLFSVSVVYLILAHLFMLTRLHPALAGSVIALAGLSSLLHVLAPVIIWKTSGFFWLMPVSGAAMAVSWTLMSGWTLLAMWLQNPKNSDAKTGA
jgi:hypothetical protein